MMMIMVVVMYNDMFGACIYRYCSSSVNGTGDWPKKCHSVCNFVLVCLRCTFVILFQTSISTWFSAYTILFFFCVSPKCSSFYVNAEKENIIEEWTLESRWMALKTAVANLYQVKSIWSNEIYIYVSLAIIQLSCCANPTRCKNKINVDKCQKLAFKQTNKKDNRPCSVPSSVVLHLSEVTL